MNAAFEEKIQRNAGLHELRDVLVERVDGVIGSELVDIVLETFWNAGYDRATTAMMIRALGKSSELAEPPGPPQADAEDEQLYRRV